MERTTSPERQFDIVTDSAADLPFEYCVAHDVTLVPMRVRLGGEDLADDTDLHPEDFYLRYADGRAPASTSQPSPADVSRAYGSLVAGGTRAIVSAHVSGVLSGTLSSARTAARDASKQVPCHVMDTGTVSAAQGLVVRALVAARDRGASPEEAIALADEVARGVRLYYVPPVEAPLPEGGFLSRTRSVAARIAGVMPLMRVDRERGLVREGTSPDLTDITGRIARIMSGYAAHEGPLCYVEIGSGLPRRLSLLEKPLDTNEFESCRIGIANAAPSIVCHVGLGAIGIAFAPASCITKIAPKEESHA